MALQYTDQPSPAEGATPAVERVRRAALAADRANAAGLVVAQRLLGAALTCADSQLARRIQRVRDDMGALLFAADELDDVARRDAAAALRLRAAAAVADLAATLDG